MPDERIKELVNEELKKLKEMGEDKYIENTTNEVVAKLIMIGNMIEQKTDIDVGSMSILVENIGQVSRRVYEELISSMIEQSVVASKNFKERVLINFTYVIASKLLTSYIDAFRDFLEECKNKKKKENEIEEGYL